MSLAVYSYFELQNRPVPLLPNLQILPPTWDGVTLDYKTQMVSEALCYFACVYIGLLSVGAPISHFMLHHCMVTCYEYERVNHCLTLCDTIFRFY